MEINYGKTIKLLLLAILVIFFLYIGKRALGIWKISHEHNYIRLMGHYEQWGSLRKILDQPELKGKVVYVDVWGARCPACFQEFEKYTPLLTERYRDSGKVAFLYFCIDRDPLADLRWKYKLNKYKPRGFHVLVTGGAGEILISKDIVGKAVDDKYFPYMPFYFLVNKKGEIIDNPSVDPDRSELKPSDQKKLYDKIDSLLK